MNVNKFEILWKNGVTMCEVTIGDGVVTITDTKAFANKPEEVAGKIRGLLDKAVDIIKSRTVKDVIGKYEVRDVVCDYGIFERGELKLITNSRANALLIKEILDADALGHVYRGW